MNRPFDPFHRVRLAPPAGEGNGTGPPSLAGTGHLRIARDGTWYHEGRPFRRKDLARLFSTVLRREDDGSFRLKTPVESVPIEVEDAPFIAEELHREGEGRDQVLWLRTNLDHWVAAGPEHPIRVAFAPESAEPRPYILVRDGLEALIVRPVFYELAGLAQPRDPSGRNGDKDDNDGEVLGIWSQGAFFPLEPGTAKTPPG